MEPQRQPLQLAAGQYPELLALDRPSHPLDRLRPVRLQDGKQDRVLLGICIQQQVGQHGVLPGGVVGQHRRRRLPPLR